MTYDKYDNIAVAEGFDIWFDELTQQKRDIIVDDILPTVLASGQHYHGFTGISTDWHHGYSGMGVF